MALLRSITNLVRSFRAVEGAVTHHGERVSKILDEEVNPQLPEAMRIDFWTFMRSALGLLRFSCDRLTGAEGTLVSERSREARQRQQRDDDARALSAEILDFRTAFEGIFKPVNVEEYGFPQNVGRQPLELLRQGEHLVGYYENPDAEVPAPVIGDGLPIPSLVDGVKTKTDQLRLSMSGVEREERTTQIAQVEKDRAAKLFQRFFLWGGRIIAGLFHWAGEQELAARITPSVRRPGRTREIAAEEDQAASGGGEAPGEAPGETPGEPADSDTPASEPAVEP